MNIKNFEEEMDPEILRRGHAYFENDLVGGLCELEPDHFQAIVEGTHPYETGALVTADGEIGRCWCDCPYDWSEHCKHEVALLYAIRALQSGETKTEPAKDLRSLLFAAPHGVLVNTLVRLASEDGGVRQRLLLEYAGGEDLETVRRLVRSSIQAAGGDGFVEYRDLPRALEGADRALGAAEGQKEPTFKIRMALTVLSPLMELLSSCDDFDGLVGENIQWALDLVRMTLREFAAAPITSQQRGDLIAEVIDEALSSSFEGWDDYRVQLLEACVPFSGEPVIRAELDKALGRLEHEAGADARYSGEQLALLRYSILRYNQEDEAAGLLLEAHLGQPGFRELALQAALERGEMERVLALAKEGIAQDAALPGLTEKWMGFAVKAYQALGDTEQLRGIYTELLLGGDFSCYEPMKKLFTAQEWGETLEELLTSMEHSPRRSPSYIPILLEEQLHGRLLEYCRQNPTEILRYYGSLEAVYPQEVEQLFMNAIHIEARDAQDRSQYRSVCGMMRTYRGLFGEATALQLVDQLKHLYPRRAAFQDELNKL